MDLGDASVSKLVNSLGADGFIATAGEPVAQL